MDDPAGVCPGLGAASGQERAATYKHPLWAKQHAKRGARQELGHHPCKHGKVGGRERAPPGGWVGTCQPRAPIGRWASSCGCSGSPSPPVVAEAPPWGWGGRAGQMEDYLFPSPAPTQHLKRFLDHVNFVKCCFLNTFFCCVCCVNSLRPGHRWLHFFAILTCFQNLV